MSGIESILGALSNCCGAYDVLTSLFVPGESRPGIVPIITGCCLSNASRKKPNTVVPSIRLAVDPTPFEPAEVTGCITVAHGKCSVGNCVISSLWCPMTRTFTLPNRNGSVPPELLKVVPTKLPSSSS